MKQIFLPPPLLAARHVFVKSHRGHKLFNEPADYLVYLALLKQYVRLQQALDYGQPDSQAVKVHGFCLQRHTIQLLITDITSTTELTKLMRAIHISYGRYYAKKYRTNALIFSDVYKSTVIDNNRDKTMVLMAMHAITANKWYQDSRHFYEPGRADGWITPLSAPPTPQKAKNKISHMLLVDK